MRLTLGGIGTARPADVNKARYAEHVSQSPHIEHNLPQVYGNLTGATDGKALIGIRWVELLFETDGKPRFGDRTGVVAQPSR